MERDDGVVAYVVTDPASSLFLSLEPTPDGWALLDMADWEGRVLWKGHTPVAVVYDFLAERAGDVYADAVTGGACGSLPS